jgi:cation transport ATPase
MEYKGKVEYAQERKLRTRNTRVYRSFHWPIWIFVFFLAPGPLTFKLFAHEFNWWNWAWLGTVLVCTGVAALRGRLPGAEPGPYILRFDEDKPNPLYRRVCYTFAWTAALSYALLNLAGLTIAAVSGVWQMKQIYYYAYFPLAAVILLLGALGKLPRVEPSTRKEGTHRRYFYGTVWSVTAAQTVLLVLWKVLPQNGTTSWVKLGGFVGMLALMGWFSYRGMLPRTRPILPGECMVAD